MVAHGWGIGLWWVEYLHSEAKTGITIEYLSLSKSLSG